MKGWIIYPHYVSLHGDNAFGWMREEAKLFGIDLEVVFFEELTLKYGKDTYSLLHNNEPVLKYPEFVIMRGYENEISRHFELMDIPVINSSQSMAACKDKLLTGQLLAKNGVSTPLTIGNTGKAISYRELTKYFEAQDFIVKRRDGAKGEDVYLVKNEEEMQEAIDACEGNCIFQKFIEESYGKDLRVWVIGGEAVACVLRYSENSFKSNFSLGGKVGEYELTPEIAGLSERSSGLLGLEFAGVDLLFTGHGFTVCEINGNAGFRTLSQVSKNIIPNQLFRYIKKEYGNK